MTTLFSDNAQGSLAITAEVGATSLVLLTGEGGEFPALRSGFLDQCFVRLGTNGLNEVVRVNGRTGDTLNCEPLTNRWLAGTEVSLTLNRRSIEALRDEILGNLYGISNGLKVFETSGIFVWPADTTHLRVTVVGGGGGGGGARLSGGTLAHGGDGGDGPVLYKLVDGGLPGDEVVVTVGSGGAGGFGDPTNGSVGGISSFGMYLTVGGGERGFSALSFAGTTYGVTAYQPPNPLAVPPSGLGVLDPVRFGNPFAVRKQPLRGPGDVRAGAGLDGVGYGAAGLGAICDDAFGIGGGDGAPGVVIVEW
jgi:hypothetical protein